MVGYRDDLEAATLRVAALEEEQHRLAGRIRVLEVSGPRPARRIAWAVAYSLALVGATLALTLFVTRREDADEVGPAVSEAQRGAAPPTFADPLDRRPSLGGVEVSDANAMTEELPTGTCAASERKAQLALKVARGEASDHDLAFLNMACTIQKDAACQRFVESRMRAPR